MAKTKPCYRIRVFIGHSHGYEYSDGNARGGWNVSTDTAWWTGYNGTWSRKGKIFFTRKELRKYLNQFVDYPGQLEFSIVAQWEIEEIGDTVTIKKPAEFYHTWEHLTGKLFSKETP